MAVDGGRSFGVEGLELGEECFGGESGELGAEFWVGWDTGESLASEKRLGPEAGASTENGELATGLDIFDGCGGITHEISDVIGVVWIGDIEDVMRDAFGEERCDWKFPPLLG